MHRFWLTVATNYMYRKEVIKPSLLTDPSVFDNAVWPHALGNHKGSLHGRSQALLRSGRGFPHRHGNGVLDKEVQALGRRALDKGAQVEGYGGMAVGVGCL